MSRAIESMVKITIRVLKGTVKDRQCTDDNMYIFLTEVELIENSCPLTSVSDSISDSEALTPKHFIIGRQSNNLNKNSNQAIAITLKRKRKTVQSGTGTFLVKWIWEYLPTLTER